MFGFTVLETWLLGGTIVVSPTALLLTYIWWPKGGKHTAEARTGSMDMKLYTADIQRGTQHWHDLSNPRPDGRVDLTPDVVEALQEVGWLPDITDPSLLKLTPANEAQGATEEWSPSTAVAIVTDFVEEQEKEAKQALIPWNFMKPDPFKQLDELEDLKWELLFRNLDNVLEEQARRCDAAVEAIFPGKQLVLVS